MDVRPIDANALLEIIEAKGKEYGVTVSNRCTFRDILKHAPTIDYAPVMHGEWVEEIEPNVITASGRDVHLWRCSSCGFTWANKHDVLHYFKHCPNCGTKMERMVEHVSD